MTTTPEDELRDFVARWCRATLLKDVQAAAAMRSGDYRATLGDGGVLTRSEELALLGGPGLRVERCAAANLRFERDGERATILYDCDAAFESNGTVFAQVAPCRLEVLRTDRGWQASAWAITGPGIPSEPPPPAEERRKSLLARLQGRLRRRPEAERSTFQDVAYLPYRPREDYLLPPREPAPLPGALPMPPEHLWLGYNYPAHGALHVKAMLDICEAGGFAMARGKRVLDLGCGAGRMIRHFEPYADGANIWGVDISAEHILWCKRNLSPPFSFAATTKVPHLPFEDRSFDLIYCGSVFTHIDDLADAWLLELRRILSPEGRLFVTIHDERTMALLGGAYSRSPLAGLRKHPLFAEAEQGFSVLAIGRDDLSQVFYAREEFLRMTAPGFETVSVTEEAYFYQTAVLLRRR
ncbi:MAG TPA: class I SAM-dependent methyltransferase [Allosphingosinicella sp.]|nr:class I SAM-dependent methyltransferase [Allosphingosinicella sp.]